MRYSKDPRIRNNLGIAVSVVHGSAEPASRALTLHMTEDISRSGLRFRHDKPLPVDTVIRILVALDAPAQTITKLGRVRWSSPREDNGHLVGVELTSTSSVGGIAWNNYVMRRQREIAA